MRLTRTLLFCAALLPGSVELWAGADVRLSAGRLDVRATAVPLRDLLTEIARHTGMQVIYEGSAPREIMTVTLVDCSEPDAVVKILEGLGLQYALLADPSGRRVKTLFLASPMSATKAAAATGSSMPVPHSEPFMASRPPVERSPITEQDLIGGGVGANTIDVPPAEAAAPASDERTPSPGLGGFVQDGAGQPARRSTPKEPPPAPRPVAPIGTVGNQ